MRVLSFSVGFSFAWSDSNLFLFFYFLQIFRFFIFIFAEIKPYLYHPSKKFGKIRCGSGMLHMAAKDADLFDFQVQEGDLLVLGRVPQQKDALWMARG